MAAPVEEVALVIETEAGRSKDGQSQKCKAKHSQTDVFFTFFHFFLVFLWVLLVFLKMFFEMVFLGFESGVFVWSLVPPRNGSNGWSPWKKRETLDDRRRLWF